MLGSRAERVLKETEKNKGFPKISTTLEAFKALSDRRKTKTSPGETLVIWGSGNSADTLIENIAMLVTADHGNADQMTYEDGSTHTSHSDAPVPLSLMAQGLENQKVQINHEGLNALKDVAPTVLHLLGINKPREFTGITVFE